MGDKRKYIMLKDSSNTGVGYAKIQNDRGNNKIVLVLENMKSNETIIIWAGDSKTLDKKNIGRVILDKQGRGELKTEIVIADIDTILGMIKDKTIIEGYDGNSKSNWDREIKTEYPAKEQIDCKTEGCECRYIEQEQIDIVICEKIEFKNPYIEQKHIEICENISKDCNCPYIEQLQPEKVMKEENSTYLEGEYEEIIKALRMLERSRETKFYDCDWFRVQDKLPYLQRAELLSGPFLCTERLADNAYQCKIGIEYDKQGEKIKNIYFAVPEGLWNEEDIELRDKGFNIKTEDYLIKAMEVK